MDQKSENCLVFFISKGGKVTGWKAEKMDLGKGGE
jgi:hypothetical protein